MSYHTELLAKLDDVKGWVEELEIAEKSNYPTDSLHCGLHLLKSFCNLLTWVYTNTHESYRNQLSEALVVDSSMVADQYNRDMNETLYVGKFFYKVQKSDFNQMIMLEKAMNVFYLKNGTGFIEIVNDKIINIYAPSEIIVLDKEI